MSDVHEGGGAVEGADDDHDVLVYDMTGWESDDREQLRLLLDSEGIPHQWDGDELLVPDTEEERVDALMDQVEFPEALDAVDDSGERDEQIYQVLSDLFVAADRVASGQVVEVEEAGDLVAAANAASAIPTPYGIDEPAWAAVREAAGNVARLVVDESDDGTVRTEAAALRERLRPYV